MIKAANFDDRSNLIVFTPVVPTREGLPGHSKRFTGAHRALFALAKPCVGRLFLDTVQRLLGAEEDRLVGDSQRGERGFFQIVGGE